MYYYYYYGNDDLKLYLEYDYLKVTDTIYLLKGIEELYKEILELIGKNEFIDEKSGDRLRFSLVIDEAKTGNSIDFGFSQIWETVNKKKKNNEERITKKIEVNFSFGLKEVVACLMIIGAGNYQKKIDSKVNSNQIENSRQQLMKNSIWIQISNNENNIKVIENKADSLIKKLLKNPTINEIKIQGVKIK